MVREAGKTLENALADLREAVDFLRYYACEARRQFAGPVTITGPTGETNTLDPARTRPLRLHQPLELSAGDLHGPGGGGARSRQSRARQAGRADAHHRLPRHAASARGRRARRRAAAPARRRRASAPRWSRIARVAGVVFTGSNETGWSIQRALAVRARRHHPLHRRDRRHQCHDRRLERAARAGDPRSRALGVRLGRAALLGRAPVLRAGGRGQADDRHAGRRHRGARYRRSARLRHRHRPRHRRGRLGQARVAQAAHAEAGQASWSTCRCPMHAAPAPTSRRRPTRSAMPAC